MMKVMDEESAGKCPLCGRDVHPGQEVCTCGAVVRGMADLIDIPIKRTFDYGMLAPWVPFVASLLLLWWLCSPEKFMYSFFPVIKVYLITVILTSVLALLVAEKEGPPQVSMGESGSESIPPLAWFAVLLFAWPVLFPFFFHAYYSESNRKRMYLGWVFTGIFLLAFLALWYCAKHRIPGVIGGAPKHAMQPVAPAASRTPADLHTPPVPTPIFDAPLNVQKLPAIPTISRRAAPINTTPRSAPSTARTNSDGHSSSGSGASFGIAIRPDSEKK